MKAVIAAGGRATRMRPITYTINKHLIPLANKPMIVNAIEKIAAAGVTEIAINVNPGEEEIQKVCGDGSKWGVKLTYLEQTGGPLGLAHILRTARPFVGDEPFVFYLGDNIILGSIKRFVEKLAGDGLNCVLALSRVKDPQRFGVPELKDGRILRVDEKPSQPKSDFAVTGIYVYDKNVFKAADAVKPSARGELEISDVHTWLIENGYKVGYEEITGWWKDTGKPEDLLEGNALLLDEMTFDEATSEAETVAENVRIQGKVKIGKGTKLGPNVLIRGPVAIGENCLLSDAYVGPYTSIGSGVSVTGTEIEHSIVCEKSMLKNGGRLVDSLIGRNVTVAAAHHRLPEGKKLIVGDNSSLEL